MVQRQLRIWAAHSGMEPKPRWGVHKFGVQRTFLTPSFTLWNIWECGPPSGCLLSGPEFAPMELPAGRALSKWTEGSRALGHLHRGQAACSRSPLLSPLPSSATSCVCLAGDISFRVTKFKISTAA